MDLRYGPEYEEFRTEVRRFLEAHRDDAPHAGIGRGANVSRERIIAWQRTLIEHGYAARTIPRAYGGYGATPDLVQSILIDEEFSRAGVSRGIAGQGASMLVPTLLEHGSEEQKQKYVGPTIRGELLWCQGYSEPGSGSDLASLQTRAAEDGDDFVVNGQKVWTSDAHHADMCFLLVRTDPAAPKHRGISYLLVDMHSPGITVRPLVQMTGDRGFNEMFFEDVRVPKKNLVGEKNNGWLVALTSLMFERRARDMRPIVHELAALARHVQRGDAYPSGNSAWDD